MTARWRRLPHASSQSALAVSAIAAAVMLPVVLLSVGGGVSDHEIGVLEHAGYQIVVAAAGLHGIDDAHSLAASIDQLSGVTAASPVLSVPLDVFGRSGGAVPALAEGVVPGAFEATESPQEKALLPASLALGDPTDLVHFANGSYRGPLIAEVLLSAPIASSLGLTVGSSVSLSNDANRSDAVPFTLTGLLAPSSPSLGVGAAYGMILPLTDLQELSGWARSGSGGLLDAADTIEVAVGGAAALSSGTIARIASQIQTLVPFYGVSTLSDQVRQSEAAAAVLNGFYLALSSVGIAIGLVFLAIVLVRRVETERRSIAIRRAIGVPQRQIALLMLDRALRLGGVGVAAGVVGGVALVRVLSVVGSPYVREAVGDAVFDPALLGPVLAGFLLLAAVSSLSATRSAAHLSIPKALR